MSNYLDNLEKNADRMFATVGDWETNALRRLGSRVKKIGSLSYADLQAINNAAIVNQDVEAVMKELAELTRQNVRDVRKMYDDMIAAQHEENRYLYDYRNKPFIPFAENKELQAITKAFARTTAETFVNLSMTKAKRIGFVDKFGKFQPIDTAWQNVIDKAVMSVSTGTGDFNSEMLDILRQLGGSGVRVDYGNDITRNLDSMVRQNVLWGAKQTFKEYEHIIGDELGCNGIEIDWHSYPRPLHEFMQGKQYILGKARTVNGIYFESADKALEALEDYGCLHFETRIICGVSEPVYSPEELKRLNEENNRPIEIDGVTKTGYEWKQTMRRLEREGKSTKLKRETFKSAGNNVEARNQSQRLKAIEEKYNLIADKTGIKAQYERMAVVKGKSIDNSAKSGIINTKIINNRVANPMNKERYQIMRNGLLKNGIKTIEARGDDLKYLRAIGAEASYGHGYIMHIGPVPSASAMFEEIIHSTQAKIYGEFDSSDVVELCAREIPANRMLLRHKLAYGFDEADVDDITRNLKHWEESFKKEVGCSYDESSYRREI